MRHVSPYVPVRLLKNASALEDVCRRWQERQRHWHGPRHLMSLLAEIDAANLPESLALTALYHDAVYDPQSSTNEEDSATLLLEHAASTSSAVVAQAVKLIRASKWDAVPEDTEGRAFFDLDTHQLSDRCALAERLEYERAIFREYQWVDVATYCAKRREFLLKWAQKFPQHSRGVEECLGLLDGLAPRVAIYPGSFNPFHSGHLSILRQAEAIFDKVIVAVGVNRQKAGAVETAQQRCAELKARLRFHEVTIVEGLLTDFIDRQDFPLTIVRGVRDGTDLEAELRYVRFLNDLRPQTSVTWISCEAELQHLSSSAIRELESISPGSGARYLPETAAIYGLRGPLASKA